MIEPKEKIKVFISSACGSGEEKQKYNLVRKALQLLIESTNLAKVYLFEEEGASTLTASQHYSYELEDSDLCIFLIDNKDGVPNGVQKEIDIVNKYGIKSLYYFCDENSKEATPLQKSLLGASYAKSKVVHSFEEFIKSGAKDLVEDLIKIYKNYCKGRIYREEELKNQNIEIPISNFSVYIENIASKDVVIKSDKCRNYFSKLVLNTEINEVTSTNKFDELCLKFLSVLFGGVKLESKLLDLLLKELENYQSNEHFLITKKRYEAIKSYFSGNIEKCVLQLEEALKTAKENSLPEWIIKDILIDLRNINDHLCEKKNNYSFGDVYQKELDESNFPLHYPLMDRFNKNYYEKIVNDLIKYKLQSPYTIVYADGINLHTYSLTDIYFVAMYNGSITYLKMLYSHIMKLAFYCVEKYSDWHFKVLLLKMAVVNTIKKDIDNVIMYLDKYLGKINSFDAIEIFQFANNIPIEHQRLSAKLESFKIVGYFLDDVHFSSIWEELYGAIINWIENDNRTLSVASHIFSAINNNYIRIKQENIAEITIKLIEGKFRRYYYEVFDMISKCINIKDLPQSYASKLIDLIIDIVKEESEGNYNDKLKYVIMIFRKQNRDLTQELDETVKENMESFYENDYCFETTENEEEYIPHFIDKYIKIISKENEKQGVGGQFAKGLYEYHLIIKSILKDKKVDYGENLINAIFEVSCQTLIKEKQLITEKINAIVLIMFLIHKYPNFVIKNKKSIDVLLSNKDLIENGSAIMTNLNNYNLKFFSLLLYRCLGENVDTQIIEMLASISDSDTLSQINASKGLISFMDLNNKINSIKLETVFLQNALKWCNAKNLTLRYNAINILFELLNNAENNMIILNQLVKTFDVDNVDIKSLVLKNLHKIEHIDNETYKYIIQKAKLDTNYVVRKKVEEIQLNYI